MKRLLVLAALLTAAPACAPADQGTGNANLTANTNSRASPTPTPAGASEADLVALDRQIWEAIKTKNWDAFAAHLADDAVTVTNDGIYNKAQTLEGLKALDLSEYTVSDTKVVRLDHDAAVLTYNSTSKASYDGQPLPNANSRDTTVFVKRGDKWLAIFHQETAVAPPMLMPTPSGTPAASASPAAAASPAAPPANVTEAEQRVWDALKRKDWAAFAGFIADDQIEVEPEGVFNRAQTLEMVKQFDASTLTLGDFREVKLDGDASVLTYTVKGTGKGFPPKGQRHSTVWVNRNGRWQAVFHQGTNIEK